MRDICCLDHEQEQTQIDQIEAHGRFHEELAPSALPEATYHPPGRERVQGFSGTAKSSGSLPA
jgi:hypothetical protein